MTDSAERTTVDEEALVQQILNENPSEEVGLREEWKDRVGWHRKEDIRSDILKKKARQQLRGAELDPYPTISRRMDDGPQGLGAEAAILGNVAIVLAVVSAFLVAILILDWIRFRIRATVSQRKDR
jgi:hypothetical protein